MRSEPKSLDINFQNRSTIRGKVDSFYTNSEMPTIELSFNDMEWNTFGGESY